MPNAKIWVHGVAAIAALAGVAAQSASMRLSDGWPLSGPVSWDYLALDASGAHLFVTRGTQVDVLDTRNGKVIATIAGTSGAHGVALAEDTQRGYISNGRSDTVTMFDLTTYKTLQESPVSGHNPDAILYDTVGKHVFTFNGRSSDVSVLAPADLKVLATLKVPGKPEFAVADEQGLIYANIETEPGQLAVIDARKLEVKAVWPLTGCDGPSGLAIDKTHRRLFSVCDHQMMVVTDAATGKQIARVKIGDEPDAVAYDPQRSLVFSSNGEGDLTVVHQDTPDKYSVVQTLVTKKGARTMALDPASGAVYLSSAEFPAAATTEHTRPQATPNSFAIIKASPAG